MGTNDRYWGLPALEQRRSDTSCSHVRLLKIVMFVLGREKRRRACNQLSLADLRQLCMESAVRHIDTPGRLRASLKGVKALGVGVLGRRHARNMSNSSGLPNRARSG